MTVVQSGSSDPGGIPPGDVVGSEFAQVEVTFDRSGNGMRLRLRDLRTGRVRFLDALELETIVWLSDGNVNELLDPSADRWNNDGAR